MTISRQDELDLLTALHEGVLESPLWSTFLKRMRSRLRADHAGLIIRRGDGQPEVCEFVPERPSDPNKVPDPLSRLEPILNAHMRPDRVYAMDELLHPRPVAGESAARFSRQMRVSEAGGYDGWIVVTRDKEDFDAGEAALVSALAPHMAIAIRTYAAIQRERLRADISGEAIQRLNFGWITLDAAGIIVDYDEQADRLLRQSTALRRTAAGRLVPTSRQAEGALARLLRQVAAGETIRSQAIHLSDEPWLDMLVASIRDQPFSRSKAPVLVAYVHGEERSSTDRTDQLMDLFGLTRSEARLAIALSHGRSIADAAKDLGLTLETTRLYSKRIYAKTGTKGQADLVRLVLASVVALA